MSTNGMIFVSFASGAVAGAAVSWILAKRNYERIANEDHEKELELRKMEDDKRKEQENDICKPVTDALSDLTSAISSQDKSDPETLAASVIKNSGYHGESLYSEMYQKNKREEEKPEEKLPYLIDVDSVGEFEEYDVITLTYYIPDHALADENDHIIEDMEHVLGSKVLDELDENADNGDVEAYARDDRLKCDYEIVLERESYFDVVGG